MSQSAVAALSAAWPVVQCHTDIPFLPGPDPTRRHVQTHSALPAVRQIKICGDAARGAAAAIFRVKFVELSDLPVNFKLQVHKNTEAPHTRGASFSAEIASLMLPLQYGRKNSLF
jgi:hypothetical protein